jgi:hypothetical protein
VFSAELKSKELAMATLFREFSNTYEIFVEKFPSHPLTDEIKSRISRGRFPSDSWMKSCMKKMNDLMAPFWLKIDEESDQAVGE